MNEVTAALYQAVQQNENHAATINRLLDVLRAGRRNARRANDTATYARCEAEIERYTELLGTIHAQRADLARRIRLAKTLTNADIIAERAKIKRARTVFIELPDEEEQS